MKLVEFFRHDRSDTLFIGHVIALAELDKYYTVDYMVDGYVRTHIVEKEQWALRQSRDIEW